MTKTLLLVDDLDANIMALEAILDDDFSLVSSTSPVKALELVLSNDIDVAIIDVNMPEMGGYEMAEYLRMSPKTAHIPILFVTADDADKKEDFTGWDKAPVDYVYKPVESDLLIEAINKVS